MLNISIPSQIAPLSKNTSTPDTSTANQSGVEKFRDVLAREISDNTLEDTKDTARASSEESLSETDTGIKENSAIDVHPAEETNSHFSPTASLVNTMPELAGTTIGNQRQIPAAPALTSSQVTQRFSIYNGYSNSDSWQSFAAANSAFSDHSLPAFAETGNNLLSGIEESAKFSLPGSTHHSGLNNLTTLASPAMSTAPVPHDIGLDAQVGQPKWNSEFSQKIVWLTSQQHQSAEIRLNPAHLGPVEVMINIVSEQATAQFVSPHAATREAIEAALPKLKEMMAENGITLGNVTVGADSFRQHTNSGQHENKPARYSTSTGEADDGKIIKTETSVASNRHNGIVNTFA